MSFTFVTSYFNLNNEANDINFKLFDKLVETNFQVILFLDKKLEEKKKEYEKYSNVQIILFNWDDLYLNKLLNSSKIDQIERPSEYKDDLNSLILSNSKTYLLKLAKELFDLKILVWIDLTIIKYLDTNDTIECFKRNFAKLRNYNKIVIPGGIGSLKLLVEDNVFKGISDRFLSGLLVCPENLIDKFHDSYMNEVELLLKEKSIKQLTWDVNYLTNIEQKNPNLIHYYRTSYGKQLFSFYDKKVILVSMIKNEEKIIRRCIDSVRSICDAFCVSDTMSTDNTVNIVKDYITELEKQNVPGKIYQNPWSDFGSNRTIAYRNTVDFCNQLGWDPENTWGLLLDADMKLVITSLFNKQNLSHNGYKIIQENSHMEYHNTRFVKLNNSWKCVGVTHEYWDGQDVGTLDKSHIYINDIGDGGCKDDKFERDMRLLVKGIEEEPDNARYHFYLAQTCSDMGKYREAIQLYKKRIKLGGWDEEVWYSHYTIAKCYLKLNDIHKAELWANRAYDFRKSRAEPVFLLTNIFRERGQNIKAYHYYKIGKAIPESFDSLFVEKKIYKYMFDYEYTIIQYWVFSNERLEGLKHCINYMNKFNFNEDNVFSNVDHYLQRLADNGSLTLLSTPNLDNYTVSSPSVISINDKIMLNLRYINYKIEPDGGYSMFENGSYSHDNNVITKNAVTYLNDQFKIDEPVLFDNEITDLIKRESRIKGLEDVRLFNFKQKVYYTATTKEYSNSDIYRIIYGEYDIENHKYINNKILYPPVETNCEKNWIPINHKDDKLLFIYNWHPLQIGTLNDLNKLNIIIKHETPTFFKHYRGSTILCEYKNELWCLTHGVKYSKPRKYFHQFVVLEKDTYKPIRFTVPFYFSNYKIEYCNGLIIKDDHAIIVFSQNDKDPNILKINMDKLNELIINV